MTNEEVAAKAVLGRLVNEQLSAVSFVQDYLQLDFDGPRLTVNVWPLIRTERRERRFSENGYRDDLCSFIGHRVIEVKETEASIEVVFDAGAIYVDLLTESVNERVIFEDSVTRVWAWW